MCADADGDLRYYYAEMLKYYSILLLPNKLKI